MTAIIFSRGQDHFDAHPTQRVLPSFDEFETAVLQDRSTRKGQAYIAAPFKFNGNGQPHRCKEGALSRVWLPFDLDGMRDGAAFVDLCLWLQRFRGFAYTTASHRPDAPRARLVLEASRPVDRGDGQRVCLALEHDMKAHLGTNVVTFDQSVYRGEQPCFTPLIGAQSFRFDGTPVDIDTLLTTAPEIDEAPGTAERAKATAANDPILRHLFDNRMVKREIAAGHYAVVCPCADSHSSESNETSTVYMLPNFGGVSYGKFNCLHQHCHDRKQPEFITALGLDPKRVWKAQATAGRPEVVEDQLATQKATRDDLHGREVSLIRGDTIPPEPICWIWDGWLAAGKFHVLAGQPGAGKTTLALAFAATITSGGRWPDGSRVDRGSVLIWSGEDDRADTLVPRLRAMGADMSRVYFVDTVRDGIDTRPFDPAHDIPELVRAAQALGVLRLLIVDPVVSAVAGDSHKNAETRRSLQPLVDLAWHLDCAVLGISHFTKGTSGREPVERVTGSLAFGALPRVVLVAAKLPEDRPEPVPARLLARAKSNVSPDTGGFGYDLDHRPLDGFPGVSASRVLWGPAIEGTARTLLAEAEQDNQEARSELDAAKDFLSGLLADGPVSSKQIRADADGAGHAWATVRRAQVALGIEAIKQGLKGGWVWELPSKMLKNPEDAQQNVVSTFGQDEHLRAPDAPIKPAVADF